MTAGAFLIVEDEPALLRSFVGFFSKYRSAHGAGSLAAARELLTGPTSWIGFVIDVGLPDGSGFDLVETIRRRNHDARILMLTGVVDAKVSNAAYRHAADCIEKPVDRDNLVRFVRRCLALEQITPERLRETVDILADAHALTPRETEILTLALQNLAQKQIAETLGISPQTLKDQVESLRTKFRADTLHQLSLDVACAALGTGPLRLK